MSELEYHTCVNKCEGLGLGESLGISECMGRSGDGERGLKAWLYNGGREAGDMMMMDWIKGRRSR